MKIPLIAAMERVLQALKEFHGEATVMVRAPGCLNLVGDHTGEHEGLALSIAVESALFFAFRPNGTESDYVVQELDRQEQVAQQFGDKPIMAQSWANFVMGTIEIMRAELPQLKGFHCYIAGSLAENAALGAASALCCGLAAGLAALAGVQMDPLRLARLSQKASHEYAGTFSGIRDFATIMLAQAAQATLLDGQSLEYQHLPLPLAGYRILLIGTQVEHDHAQPGILARRAQTQEGLKRIQAHFPEVENLRDMQKDMLSSLGNEMPQEILCRCAFFLGENSRVARAAEHIRQGRLAALGDIMFETHVGLRDLYHISSPELDYLAELSAIFNGCLGARMVGNGFGGSLLAIVKEEMADQYTQGILQRYQTQFGKNGKATILKIGQRLEVKHLK